MPSLLVTVTTVGNFNFRERYCNSLKENHYLLLRKPVKEKPSSHCRDIPLLKLKKYPERLHATTKKLVTWKTCRQHRDFQLLKITLIIKEILCRSLMVVS